MRGSTLRIIAIVAAFILLAQVYLLVDIFPNNDEEADATATLSKRSLQQELALARSEVARMQKGGSAHKTVGQEVLEQAIATMDLLASIGDGPSRAVANALSLSPDGRYNPYAQHADDVSGADEK